MKEWVKNLLAKWLTKMLRWVNNKLQTGETRYLYLFVRKDLSQSQITVQASHAAYEAAKAGLYSYIEHPHFVVIGIKNETKLVSIMNEISQHSKVYPFYEGTELTSFSTEPLHGIRRKPFERFSLL